MHLWLNITEIGFKNNTTESWTFLFLIMDMTNSSEHLLLIATPCDGLFNSLNGHCVFWQDVVINASVFFLGFCIIFTNIWIIWNLFSRSNDEDTSLVILMNLAIADTFTGGIVMYDTVYNITQFSVYVECILRIGAFIFCSLSSGLIIMLLTFQNYQSLLLSEILYGEANESLSRCRMDDVNNGWFATVLRLEFKECSLFM